MIKKAAPATMSSRPFAQSGRDSSAPDISDFENLRMDLDAGNRRLQRRRANIAEADRRGADEEDAPLDRLARRAPLQHRRRREHPLRRLGAIARTNSAPAPTAISNAPTLTALTPVWRPKAVSPLALEERMTIVEAPCATRSASSAREGVTPPGPMASSGMRRTTPSRSGT